LNSRHRSDVSCQPPFPLPRPALQCILGAR
jgi:hypothetical protein